MIAVTEVEGRLVSLHQGLKSPTGTGTNETRQGPDFVTSGTDRIATMSGLAPSLQPAEPVQWPAVVVDSTVGSGKESSFIQTLLTSGAPNRTVVDRIEPPVVLHPPTRREHVIVNQHWEGYVERLTPSGFEALLVDMDSEASPEEKTEVDFTEVSGFDRHLIRPGAVFYWSLGYRVRSSGQREGMSIIRFRRIPTWTTEALDEAGAGAQKTMDLFGWTDQTGVRNDATRPG